MEYDYEKKSGSRRMENSLRKKSKDEYSRYLDTFLSSAPGMTYKSFDISV